MRVLKPTAHNFVVGELKELTLRERKRERERGEGGREGGRGRERERNAMYFPIKIVNHENDTSLAFQAKLQVNYAFKRIKALHVIF